MKLGRKEILALILGVLVEIATCVFIFNGFSQDELILELRNTDFCFRGLNKSVFCISTLMYLISLNIVIVLGYKIINSPQDSIKLNKSFAILLSSSFIGAMLGLVITLIIGANSCT